MRERALSPFVRMAAEAIHRHYPCVHPLRLECEGPIAAPHLLTPVFRGSFDWHSAVHGHWALVRALRIAPAGAWAPLARESLNRSLTAAGLAAEHAHLDARPGFERPYGLAWLLRLAADLRGWDDADGRRWAAGLAPLESLAAARLLEWFRTLPRPIRSGEHSQSAFAMALAWDWAIAAARDDAAAAIAERARAMHGRDRDAPVRYEPSAHDFLSPILAAADLLRRVMPRAEFGDWLGAYLPHPDRAEVRAWLTPLPAPDRSDGKLSHLDGLSLSRAWMLEGVLSALSAGHAAVPALTAAAAELRTAGLRGAAENIDWMGTHWLGSFAILLLTHEAAPEWEQL